ncbi:T9SS type A sorting domain-containing protein [Arcicella sp. LKC2W]|uniref:T9SS type A sorting domain-containing protein n=1 Tax=Arcicella sp. LKC2W TaxID=2984198 RepID=UPI002B212F6B|nr:T9SS type A sorting domain-containing protein [Arcicella sp. LKC2W]MEA5457604.1 T9SS type A sorting domain-containing protein [Arcicella sp. LKC2W]
MKKIFVLLLLISINSTKAQRFYSTVFDKLPQDYQLYPRNDKNESNVPIEGKIETLGWNYCSVQIFREDKFFGYQRANLTYNNSIGSFRFNSIIIKAELAEYSFKFFAIDNKGDSVQIVSRQHIVCGDAFVIGGQSNALALVNEGDIPYRSRFARTFGGGYPYDPNMIWQLSEYGNARVGQLGGGIQRQIIEKYKIPVCIINQAIGGINLGLSLVRNESNVGDLTNNYGITYFRVKQAGLLNGGIKAFIWRQGENESSGGSGFWGTLFDQLYNYWRKDYPDINKYYIFQVSLIAWPERFAGALRDYQRRTKTIYDNVDNIACVGTKGYDGVHYDTSGHSQTAKELFRMIDRDLYGGKYNQNINSPNIQKAYFSKSNKKEITLEFESDQQMVWVNDTILIDKKGNPVKQFMKNMFYFDFNSKNDLVTDGRASNNKIILTLNAEPPSNKFNYLPPFHDDQIFQQFGGPFLTNKIGMRAFSFDGVTIEDYVAPSTVPLATPELSVQAISYKSLKIGWKAVAKATSYVLERKLLATDSFKELIKLDVNKTEYIDSALKDNTTYYYRLKALGDNPESDYGIAQGSTPAKLTKIELSVNSLSYESLKISWKAITNATSYILERKLLVTDSFKELTKLDATKTEYIDMALKDNTTYYYRLKALGNNTESDYEISQGSTSMILVADFEVQDSFNLYPNPANTHLIINFKEPVTGKLTLIGLTGERYFEENLKKISDKTINLGSYQKGTYLIIFEENETISTRKIVVE